MRKIKLGFIGTGDWGGIFLNYLKTSGDVELSLTLTTNNKDNSLLQSVENNPNKYFYYENKQTYNILLKDIDAIIVAGWAFKIPLEVINNFSCPILNIHASLLPKNRGPEPVIQQILHEEKLGGVTIHKIDADWDSGDICAQFEFNITEQDDNKTLFIKAGRTGIKALKQVIEDISSSTLSFVKQNNLAATYFSRINIFDFVIKQTFYIKDVIKLCRAFAGAYPLIVELNRKLVIIKEFTFSNELVNNETTIKLMDGYLVLKKYLYYK